MNPFCLILAIPLAACAITVNAGEAKGTLTLAGSTVELNSAVAFRINGSDEPTTLVLLSEKPVDVKAALATTDPYVALLNDAALDRVTHAFPLKRERNLPRDIAATMLFVQRASMLPLLAADAIAAAFRLTRSELRVLMAIIEIGGVPDIAAKLGVAETTVKTHLGRLFEKTGAGRQADLVKIAAGFAVPFARRASGDDKAT